MRYAVALNPGSNSLKFELVELVPGARTAGDLRKVASASLDNIGKGGTLSIFEGRRLLEQRDCPVADMQAATAQALRWLKTNQQSAPLMKEALQFAAVRVVHGAGQFRQPEEATAGVKRRIEELEELAPLHNRSSLQVLEVLEREVPACRRMVTFDTAFHRTLPEVAWRYPIEHETADRYGVRKFGFHGLSHRYMLERYAAHRGKRPEECTLVTLHLEGGNSACAIRDGLSLDTTMGLTPLEGLMMGSRSGSVDPAIVPYLMEKMGASVEDVMKLLEKQSGLLGIAGGSLDTRELVKREDRWAKMALAMYSYRVKLAVGAYLAALGEHCEAVIFGGGIGEDSPWVRAEVCAGLGGWGVLLDEAANDKAVSGEARLSAPGSRLEIWSMAVEEGLEMVFECAAALEDEAEAR